MKEAPLRMADLWRYLAGALVVVVCVAFYMGFHTLAFPEHSIHFAVTRQQAADRSGQFVGEVAGADLSDYTHATVWREDDGAKTYLEKELGVSQTAAVANDVALWGFTTRYFRPSQKEEFRVRIGPDGAVANFAHVVDEAAPGAQLSRADALALGERIRRDVAHVPGEWRLVEGTSAQRENRLDWSFTWEAVEGRDATSHLPPDARIRWALELNGDQVGEFRRYLKVPEAWARQYEGIRSANTLVLAIDGALLFVPLCFAAAFIAVRGFAGHQLRWRTPVVVAIVGAVFTAVESLNGFPLAVATYDTLSSWEAFVAEQLLTAVVTGIPEGAIILLFAVAGDRVYRARFPRALSLASSLSWRGTWSRSGSEALAAGLVGAAVAAAYQVVYHVAGKQIGIWSPADTNYSDLYSVVAPWFEVPAIGYLAASFEESAFRLFAIPWIAAALGRKLRSPAACQWIAIIVSATSWGFLHASYPQDPFYARGVELAVAGTFWGWMMVRYGILASMTAHYAFDAFLGATAVQQAGSTPNTVLSYALTAVPLVVFGLSIVRARRGGGFEPSADLVNGAVVPELPEIELPPPPPEGAWRYAPLGRAHRSLLVGVGLIALAVLAAHVVSGSEAPLAFSRAGAIARADDAMRQAGIDVSDYRATASLRDGPSDDDDDVAHAYLREVAGADADHAVFGPFIPAQVWLVRYTRPLERDEYRVELLTSARPGERPFSMTYDLAEASPGARLSASDAQAAAEAYLVGQPNWGSGHPTLVDQAAVERPSRTDYRFVFEREDVRYGEATLRAEVDVVGDHVSTYRPFIKVPEQWVREHTAVDLRRVAAIGIVLIYIFVIVGADTVGFLRRARSRQVAVGAGIVAGLCFAALGLVAELNAIPLVFAGYPTTMPIETFIVVQLVTKVSLLVVAALVAGFLFIDVLGLWREAVGHGIAPTAGRFSWAMDTALLGATLPLVVVSVLGASDESGLAVPGFGGSGPATAFPLLAAASEARLVVLGLLVALTAYLQLRRILRRDRAAFLAVLPLSLVFPLVALTRQEAGDSLLAGVAGIVVVAGVARLFLRANLAAYIVVATSATLLGGAVELLDASDPWLIWNGWALVALDVAGLIWLTIWGRRQPRWAEEPRDSDPVERAAFLPDP